MDHVDLTTNASNDDGYQNGAASDKSFDDLKNMYETWAGRGGKAVVDEADPATTSLEMRKDRDIIFDRSATVQQYFSKLNGMRTETEDAMYQAATSIAFALGFSEDHISVRSKYEFLEDMASMLEQQRVPPSVIDDMLRNNKAVRQGFYVIHDYVNAVQVLVDANVIWKYEACEDDAAEPEAAAPTRLASERMPAPGHPHQEPE